MDGREPISTASSIVILFLILAGLALVLANIVPLEGGGVDVGSSLRKLTSALAEMLAAVGLLLVIWIVFWVLRNYRRGRETPERGGKGSATSTLIMLIVMVLIIMVLPGLITNSSLFQDGYGGIGEGDDGTPENGRLEEGMIYGAFLPFFLLLSVGTVLALLFIFMKQRERPTIRLLDVEGRKKQQRAAVSKCLQEVGAHQDVRTTILTSYRRMLRLLSLDEGTDKMTAQELAIRLVEGLNWPSSPTGTLTYLFEEAKYSQHQLGEEHRTKALESLGQIENWLERRTVTDDV